MVIGAEHVEMDFHTLGFRPTPGDGFPMIGRPLTHEGLYDTVMHSGITLAPAEGLFATAELLEGKRAPLIAAYHPDRLLKAK
jgi:glycine/D-amino acid oxidase-like deaminating enzyme